MADGLAGMRIEHIAEDSEGYLWFTTWDNGVSRFDGDEFQNFTKQSYAVGRMIPARYGWGSTKAKTNSGAMPMAPSSLLR